MKTAELMVFTLFACACCGNLFAQTSSGSLKLALGGYFDSKSILTFPQQFDGKVEGKIGDGALPDAQYSINLRARYYPNTEATIFSLRDAWIKAFLGPVDLSVGNQIVAWGSTDVFTPVDIVNAWDYTYPVDPEKKPSLMARAILNGKHFNLDLLAVPFFTGPALPGSRWMKTGGNLPPGITIANQSIVETKPDSTWSNVQGGGRFQATMDWFQGVDIGLTYFRGFNTIPSLSYSMQPTGTPGSFDAIIGLSYPRYNLAGLDAALAFENGLLMRAECGYKSFNDDHFFDPTIDIAAAEGVVAAEYTMFGIKTIGEFTLDWGKWGLFKTSGDYTKTFLLIASKDIGSRYSLKVAAAYNLDESGFVSPQFTYTLADGLSAELKAYVFFGSASTTYGQFKDNRYGEFSVKYSF